MKKIDAKTLISQFTHLNTLISLEKRKQKMFTETIEVWANSAEADHVKNERIRNLTSHFDRSVLLVVEYQEEIKLITEELIRRKVWKTIKLNK